RAVATIANDDPSSFVASWTKPSVWDTGYVMNVTVRNNGPTPVEGWTLEFDLDGDITNLWDGVIVSRVGNRYTVRNESWNRTILANDGEVTFGFVADPAVAGGFPRNLKLNGVTI